MLTESAAIVLVADGLTPKALDEAIASGDVPELSALRDAHGSHVVTTVFPSVTGVAYVLATVVGCLAAALLGMKLAALMITSY